MKLDKDLKNWSFTIDGYYDFNKVSLFCKKSKLENIDILFAQIGKIMPRVTKNFNLPFNVYFFRTPEENSFFIVKFKESLIIEG